MEAMKETLYALVEPGRSKKYYPGKVNCSTALMNEGQWSHSLIDTVEQFVLMHRRAPLPLEWLSLCGCSFLIIGRASISMFPSAIGNNYTITPLC
jgi:hypothetical protein